ncbi:hypothetical protein KAF25_010930 [Fusarium avenaceum]|uniref:NAD-dependent epimerase/dehydratase domain-containing protein n=1 Tax=Fusarium avenaceum TaxID=40199 RepID=A0A9P7KJM2_9HYPO|nr:hypothetical protein KAF25_010930 [Fusarium avenaceum]
MPDSKCPFNTLPEFMRVTSLKPYDQPDSGFIVTLFEDTSTIASSLHKAVGELAEAFMLFHLLCNLQSKFPTNHDKMKALLTGGSGFIAAHCLETLLRHSHSVVTMDIREPGAFDEAIKSNPDFEGVIHCASLFHFDIQDAKKDLLDPAINDTVNIMRAIKAHAPSVRRVVVTSSAAMLNMKNHPDTYTENHWNPISREEAAPNPADGYRGSKIFAEKAAWKFVEDEKTNFTIASINPPLVFGPIAHYLNSLDRINTSNARFRDMISGKLHEKLAPTGTFHWVDVHDVALAHVRALETESAAGHRFITSGSTFTNPEIADVIKTKFPELSTKLPESWSSDLPEGLYDIDTSKARGVLNIEFSLLDQCVESTVKSVLKVQT